MHFLDQYYNNNIKYDLLNKFEYKNIQEIPKLQKILVNFKIKKYDFNLLISSLVALEFITTQKGVLTKSKNI